ncbi:hypothetical protein KIN20_007511 [Parelaphostrongylus tenuis]|uniref:Palmitoyltransferase n=1 Tax=Parelaphostrongylus tenuis TaxID=148309 RepID=A0AAD5M3I8_PARTN|nr:hypothetical protein KIN20_007511 [Parelaphostrongylus tenuis]
MGESIARAVEACQKGNLEGLESALEEGVSPTAHDDDKCTLLHWAAINNRVPIVKRLLELGADPNAVGGLLVSSPLHWACRVGHVFSSALLVKAGAVCNVRDAQGYTPIHLAVQCNQSILVAYLLEKFHYCKDITDNSGMTPVMWAAYRTFGMFPIRIIVQSGADLNAQEHLSGNTALHIAIQEHNNMSIRELLRGNADVSLRNKQQETPLDIARNMRDQRVLWKTTKRAKHLAGFFLPGFVFSLIALAFFQLHYVVAVFILLAITLLLRYFVRFDAHTTTSSLIPLGICIAEPIAMIITWFAYVHWFVSWWMQIAFFVIMFVLFGSLIKIVLSDPGVIKPRTDSHEEFVEAIERCESVNYCFTCWVDKAQSAKHCSVCDRCVMQFDHHCPWLHQCITDRNLYMFLVFIASVALSSAIYSCAAVLYIINELYRLSLTTNMRERSNAE